MADSKRQRYKDILVNPCNASAQRRNNEAIRDAFEGFDDEFPGAAPPSTGGGDATYPFVVTSDSTDDGLSAPVKIADRTATPWEFTIDKVAYDPSPDSVFQYNLKQGHFGWCRLAPEHPEEDAVEIISVEGRSRFLSGVLAETMGGGSGLATIEFQWGRYPNGFPINIDSDIVVHDRIGQLDGKVAGTPILAILDEERDQYVAFGGTGGDTILPFVCTEQGVEGRVKVLLADRSTDPLEFTIEAYANDPFYDLVEQPAIPLLERGIFFRNMKPGHFGFCRLAPEIDSPNVEVEILTLEGNARFIIGDTTTVGTAIGAMIEVEYYFGAYPNGFPVTGEVFLFDRLGFLRNTSSGTPAMGFYDEERDEYVGIAKPPVETYEPGAMHQLEICETLTNKCAFLQGTIHKFVGVNDEQAEHVRCAQVVWVTCENRELLPNTDYHTDESPPIQIRDNTQSHNALQDWCDWARDTGLKAICNGSELPVFTIRCPCEDCVCPEAGQTLTAFFTPLNRDYNNNDGVPGTAPECAFPNVQLKCVTNIPMSTASNYAGVPPHTPPIWWGEFEVTGVYPYVGNVWTLSSDITYQDEAYSEVLVVWLPIHDDPWDGRNFKIFLDVNGDYVEWTGGPVPLDANTTDVQPIVDDRGFVLMYGTEFRYGLLAYCATAGAEVLVDALFHLRKDATAIIVDPCDDLAVPTDAAYIGDTGTNNARGPSPECCHTGRPTPFDENFGTSMQTETISSVEYPLDNTGAPINPLPTFDSSISSNSREIPLAYPYLYHVLGGCRDLYAQRWDSLPQPFTAGQIEFGDETTGPAAWTVFWTGDPRKQECPD